MSCCSCTLVKTNAKFYYIRTKFHFTTKVFIFLRWKQVKEIEMHPLIFSMSTDVPTPSNQTLHVAIIMQYRRPGGIPGISQKILFHPEPRQNLLKQVWQSVVYVPKTIQGQISSDTQNWKLTASTQVEGFKHGKGIASPSLWDFLLESSRVCGGWRAHCATHWDVPGMLPLISSMEFPRLRGGDSRCLI